jgi:pimeloyl-ACP methyl ester carboxylesterase
MTGVATTSTPALDERFARVGDVELCYETFGDPAQPAMLLVMGLGAQMIGWHSDLCRELVDRGFFVVRYDNRDVGRSTRFDGVRPPSSIELLSRRPRRVAYTLGDMADDGIGLLDHLGIESAHVVGASMGGMIAQLMAARHAGRVRSLASIMSSTGARWSGQPSPRVYHFFLRPAPLSRQAYLERTLRLFDAIGSPGFDRDPAQLRAMAELSWERGISPAGTSRQLAAILACGDRTADLRRITAPTVVIHGTADRLVSSSGGRATARAIPGARLVMIDGMGHDLPRAVWPRVVEAVADNAARAAVPA